MTSSRNLLAFAAITVLGIFLVLPAGAAQMAVDKFPPNTLMIDGSAPEKRVFAEVGQTGPVAVGAVEWNPNVMAVSLPDPGDGFEFFLPTITEGNYIIAMEVRSGHQLAGWENCVPYVRYIIENKRSGKVSKIPMIRGKAKKKLRFKGEGWYDWSGWIVSRDFVSLKPHDRVRVSADVGYTYISRVVFLTPKQAAQCGWVVPGALAKTATNVQKNRAKLAAFQQRVAKAGGADFKPVMDAFDAGLADFKKRADAVQTVMDMAMESGDLDSIAALEKLAETLRKEATNPLAWAQTPAVAWYSNAVKVADSLPPVPATGDFHARWAAQLRKWITTYADDLRKDDAKTSIDRKFGRAMRIIDLSNRYRKHVKAAKPAAAVKLPTITKQPAKLREKRASVCLNGLWEFMPGNDPANPPAKWVGTLRVPHGPWKITHGAFFNPGQGWDKSKHVGWFRKSFYVPADWDARRTSVRFEAVFQYAEVYVNGVYCGGHLGGFERFSVNLAKAVRPGQMNEMTVMVHDTTLTMTDPTRNSRQNYSSNYMNVNDMWGQNYGAIWQDVYLDYLPNTLRIADVGISTPVKGGVKLDVRTSIANAGAKAASLKIRYTIIDGNKPLKRATVGATAAGGKTSVCRSVHPVKGVKLWGIGGKYGDPHLYRLHTELLDGDKVVDERFDMFGFSQMWIDGNKFKLNGKELFLAAGGWWYLQEGKFPMATRFYAWHNMRMDRKAGIALERIHRHGDMTEQYYAEAAEAGMLYEQETCWFGIAPLDALGVRDYQDPVWQPNMKQYYRDWSAKHRNYPSIGLTSLENEFYSYNYVPEQMDLLRDLMKECKQNDPLRVTVHHGNHMMGDYPGVEFVNAHYAGGKALGKYQRIAKGRPVVNGEHNSGFTRYANNRDRKVAARYEKKLADFWRAEIKAYLDNDAAGLFVFIPTFQAYMTTSDWRKTGPWGDKFKDLSKWTLGSDRWSSNFGYAMDITWPSLSGPDAKAEKGYASTGRMTFNWFDPTRPVCTPNLVHEALGEAFPKLKPITPMRCQEAMVTVTAAGKPVAGAFVTITPAEAQPIKTLGAIADAKGTAWIVPRLTGKYTVRVVLPDGRAKDAAVTLNRYKADKAGYEAGLARVSVDF